MRWTGFRKWSRVVACAAVLSPGCNCRSSTDEAVPDEGPMPQLRTGALEPQRRAPLTGTIVAHHDEGGSGALAGTFVAIELQGVPRFHRRSRVVIEGDTRALAVLTDEQRLLVHFPTVVKPGVIPGRIYVDDEGWEARPFAASVDRAHPPADGDDVVRQWVEAFAADLRRQADEARGAHPWHAFASGRVQALGEQRGPEPAAITRPRVRRTGLARLMATSTGMVSLQEGLQHDRGLRARFDDGEHSIAIDTLAPPGLARHDWSSMQAALPAATVPEEPLAAAAPADFWYFRFDSPATLGVCLQESDYWLVAARRLVDEEPHAHEVLARYRGQLGLRFTTADVVRTAMVSAGLALVGSDPYLREGSDVTAIFRTTNADALREALATMRERDLEGIETRALDHRGHAIVVYEHPRGLRQHVAEAGEFLVVSNSPGALRAVLDAIDGRRDRLADEPDFAYMRARDPAPRDAFFFAGDRFVAAVIGPEQKVLQARRQVALSELLVPGYATLLYGWLGGERPRSVTTLLEAGVLLPDELVHHDGQPIAFTVAAGARSAWGRPAFLTPLIDMPAPPMVTAAEQEAYAEFVEGYRDYWSRTIDPVAAGFDLTRVDGEQRLTMQARVLPLVENTTYDDLQEFVADARVSVPRGLPGIRITWAVGEGTRIRRRLDRLAGELGRAGLGIGWLGGWVEVGVLDRRALAVVAAALDDRIQLPADGAGERGIDAFVALDDAPVYVAAQVRNEAALAATLVAARSAASAAAPGMIEWGEVDKHRGRPVVEVRGPDVGGRSPAIYYAIADGVLVVAATRDTLDAVVDRILDGRAPTTAAGDTQFVVDVAAGEGHGVSTTMSWLFHAQALRAQDAALLDAEALLRGMPGLQGGPAFEDAARRTFGTVPVSAAGSTHFELDVTGARSPALGSIVRPHFPALPVPGSPAQAMVDHLRGFRAQVAFEPEPGAQGKSLAVRVELRLRG